MGRSIRLIYLLCLITGWLQLVVFPPPALAQQDGSPPRVIVLTFAGAVTPTLERYIEDGIAAATAQGAQAVILQLDTPGGSVDVTKSIVQRILASPVPIVVYVAPLGAQAASAGTFITLAAHVAAMAPGTSIGAASPVTATGEDVDETLAAKVKNILAADMENLAKRRGEEAARWAVAAVEEASAATAERALRMGVIDYVAADLPDLLEQLDGREVEVVGGAAVLETADAFIETVELTPIQRFLNFISNPTIAALLVTIGAAGLLAEVWNPGTWIPGFIGVVSLLLGLYGLGQLDANLVGLVLMVLGVALFIAEAFTPAFGALLVGGMIAFGLGLALLFDEPGLELPWASVALTAAALGGFIFFASAKGLAAQRRRSIAGGEGLIGQIGRAGQPFAAGGQGSVFVNGEWWNAELEANAMHSGDHVEVVGRRGYTLLVRPAAQERETHGTTG